MNRADQPYPLAATILVIVAAIIAIIIVKVTSDNTARMSTDGSDTERTAIKAEGEAIIAEMDKANRDEDWSKVREIRERENAFYERAARFQSRPSPTPYSVTGDSPASIRPRQFALPHWQSNRIGLWLNCTVA
jgi:hypothetical protein